MYWENDFIARIEVLETGVPQLARGSEATIGEFASKCGLEGAVKRWSIYPTRSFFFSGYPDSEKWEDRWRKGWNISVEFTEQSSRSHALVFAPGRPIDVRDPTWSYGNAPAESDRERYTLIAKTTGAPGQDDAAIAQQMKRLTDDVLQHFRITNAFQALDQLFLRLAFQDKGEANTLAFLSKLRTLGYLTHWHDLLAHRDSTTKKLN